MYLDKSAQSNDVPSPTSPRLPELNEGSDGNLDLNELELPPATIIPALSPPALSFTHSQRSTTESPLSPTAISEPHSGVENDDAYKTRNKVDITAVNLT